MHKRNLITNPPKQFNNMKQKIYNLIILDASDQSVTCNKIDSVTISNSGDVKLSGILKVIQSSTFTLPANPVKVIIWSPSLSLAPYSSENTFESPSRLRLSLDEITARHPRDYGALTARLRLFPILLPYCWVSSSLGVWLRMPIRRDLCLRKHWKTILHGLIITSKNSIKPISVTS